MTHGTIIIDQERCKGCLLCPDVCPQHVIQVDNAVLNARGYHPVMLVDPEHHCTGCAICAVICPEAGITVLREPRVMVNTRAAVPA